VNAAIEHLVVQFEARRLTRRELVASLAALVASASAAPAQTAAAVQGRSLNHASLAVTDVEKAADFYGALLGLKVVSRPGLYKLPNPGTVHHICIGVDNYDPEQIAERLKQRGVAATIDRNPANRTSGGDQIYLNGPDNARVQLSSNGYQG